MENIKCLQKNQQNLQKLLWVFQSTRWTCTKRPTQSQTYQLPQKSPNWFQQLENIKSLQKNQQNLKKNIKTLEQTSAVLKSRSSNLPDGSVPNGPAQIQTNQHHLKIPNLVLTTGKHRKSAKKPNKI